MNKPLLLAGFAVKVLLGLLYGYIFLHYYNGDDTWKIFRASVVETELLLNNPRLFFLYEFTPFNAFKTGNNAAEVVGIYLNDLQYVLLVKSMAIVNLVTRGNYYLNVVFFNSVVFFAHYWLYKLMCSVFPQKKKVYYFIIFLFLPAVFWLSGIRIDGLLFFFLAMYLWALMGSNHKDLQRWLMILIGLTGVLICRPQIAVLISMAGIGYFLHMRFGKPGAAYGTVYLVILLVFFLPAFHFSGIIAEKQNEFSTLKGTKFRLDKLNGSPASYLRVLPQAAGNTFIRPLPWEATGFLQLMASAEVVVFWTIIIASVINRHRFWKLRLLQPVVVMLMLLGITTYLFIGYIVPFPGAIVRYKAIPELLLLCSAVSAARWGDNKNYNKL